MGKGLTREVNVNEEFEGEVNGFYHSGLLLKYYPARRNGTCVTDVDWLRQQPDDVVKLGQKVKVRVMEIDDQHRINLSMLFGEDAKKVPPANIVATRRPFNRGQEDIKSHLE